MLPMPGLLLMGTGHRTAILIHPGHPPELLSVEHRLPESDKPLRQDDEMEYFKFRARVIALIDSLHDFNPASFPKQSFADQFTGATVVD